ncbi:MAG TPA: hypothetical protein ENN69_04680, partial [Spirochaetia bacterium]|nr:hypothetical protein [Spirochaetia bacterium]
MWATPRRPAPVFLVFLVALCGLPVVPAAGESLPLLIVADLAEDGVNEEDMKLLVDLYSYTLYETGAFEVLNRYERNKLLKGFGYDQSRLNEREAYL